MAFNCFFSTVIIIKMKQDLHEDNQILVSPKELSVLPCRDSVLGKWGVVVKNIVGCAISKYEVQQPTIF